MVAQPRVGPGDPGPAAVQYGAGHRPGHFEAPAGFERDVMDLARRMADLGSGKRPGIFELSWWSGRALEWAMSDPVFKARLFHFVDVLPTLADDPDVMRHLAEYFGDDKTPFALKRALAVARKVPMGHTVAAFVARSNVRRIARQFIVGESAEEAAAKLESLWRGGTAFTCDLLGEKTVSSEQADRYAARIVEMLDVLERASRQWPERPRLERDDAGALARVNLSIKPTALAPLFAPLSLDEGLAQAKERLRPILRLARELGAFINFDTEHYDVKDMTFRLLRELLDEREFARLEAGAVVQAYLRDSPADLTELIEWSSGRERPLTIRLVKGAYWDTETVLAAAQGWPSPVFERKSETDANYELCTGLLHQSHGKVKAAFGSHNLRSLAYAVCYARHLGIPDDGYELQMLYGMAEPIQAAIRETGLRLRLYAPVGELVPGMAYLVRRLLENTSNESFLRKGFVEGISLDRLLDKPRPDEASHANDAGRRRSGDPHDLSGYSPEPPSEWRRAEVRARFAGAVERRARSLGEYVPALIGGQEVRTPGTIVSVDPGSFDVEVAHSAAGGPREAADALAAAKDAAERWARTPVEERAGVLFRAAHWMRQRKDDLATLEIFEAGKAWAEADADVCEAIDFCEYYGRRMLELSRGGEVLSAPGEQNVLRYGAKGIAVVIAPWNFPLAIPAGMTSAALVAGNAVILKPAEQTPATAYALTRALTDSGLPPGVLNFLPGYGEEVGPCLVSDPAVNAIAFTGSKAVGLEIIQTAAGHVPGQRHVKQVIAEMGGKNAIVIDSDADLDQAVPGVVASAFGYAGQKCSAASRLIVLSGVFDEVVERLTAAAMELQIGHPRRMSTTVGPLIDSEALSRVQGYIRAAPEQGKVVLARADVPSNGFYAGPTIVTEPDPASPLVREEIFGPVLCVLRAGSFDEAVALANDSEYALTAGLYSRSPGNVRRAAEELRAGNVYINRPITGAVVGRQPFGGYGLSGVGSKAGGPDYLLQFLTPRTITENTLRQGFAGDAVIAPGDLF